MFDLFYRGGPLFMSLITLAGLATFLVLARIIKKILRGDEISSSQLSAIPIAGSTAFMLGILGQVIGLYQAMTAIQAAGDVSPALVAGGFQVSLLAPIYGLIIFVITLLVYQGLNIWHKPTT